MIFSNQFLRLFRNFVTSLEDINKNLIESEDNSLNLLHICMGFDETDFNLECIDYLLSVPDINVNSLAKINGTLGITGAHIAIEWSHYKALKRLINSGIDLFICDSYGMSAKDYAINLEDRTAQSMIEIAIHNYLSSKSYLFQVFDGNNLIKSDNEVNPESNSGSNELEFNSEPKSPKVTDLEKTIEYFDDKQNFWNMSDHKSSDSCGSEDRSGDTCISNISYEKTESIKSFYSDKTEIYVYNDRDHNVVLIEERFEGCANNSSSHLDDRHIIAKGSVTQCSADQHLREVELMNETQIYNELKAMGDTPGPVVPTTKKYYKNRLLRFRRGKLSPSKRMLALPNHSTELNLLLENKFPFDEALKLETQLIEFFEENHCKQNYFIYLLIDPNISENIPLQANSSKIVVNCCAQIDTNLFSKFIKSIFYVGKGQGNRVYQHFYEAVKLDDTQQMCPKVKRIHQIWSSNKGVTSLHCFHDISSSEALAREAMIIEALNLSNLTNQINGQYVRALKWNQRKRRLFGSYLLFKSFGIYVLSGERQIRRPLDK